MVDLLAALSFGAAFAFGFTVAAAFTVRLRGVAVALLARGPFWAGPFSEMDLDTVFPGI